VPLEELENDPHSKLQQLFVQVKLEKAGAGNDPELAKLLKQPVQKAQSTLDAAPEQVSEALAAAKAIGDEYARSQALVALAPQLAPEQVSEALAAAKAIGDEYARSQALAALARIFTSLFVDSITVPQPDSPTAFIFADRLR